ncbi:hypothetical protein ACFL54_07925 [Planctomycetota bacterium]
MDEGLTPLRIKSEWVELEAIGEPFVELTMRGYAPLLPVRDMSTDEECKVFINASSFGKKLEPMRQDNGGQFTGLKFRVKKESDERTAPYVVEPVG